MVTTTTKTLNYSITKGNYTNSVNATITSTPGFNSNYLGKIPGLLKILELILATVALGLIAGCRQVYRPGVQLTAPVETVPAGLTVATTTTTTTTTTLPPGVTRAVTPGYVAVSGLESYEREQFMHGEVYFLCAHTAIITFLVIILLAYLLHTTSAMIIPKATTLENVANIVLALLLLAAGIMEIVQTVIWANKLYYEGTEGKRAVMEHQGLRYAAGALAILNGLLFLGSFVLSRKELAGPKTL